MEEAKYAELLHDDLGGHHGLEKDSALGPPDGSLELWDAWVSAEVECDIALEGWYAARPDEKECAYAAYSAALEREAKAADFLARRIGAGITRDGSS